MKKHESFESYLQGVFMQDFQGTKDQCEDAFDRWLSEKDVNDIMQYAEQWGDVITF